VVVVLIGKHAATGWDRLGLSTPTLRCPPTPRPSLSRLKWRSEAQLGVAM
jgi:hypothetical protein